MWLRGGAAQEAVVQVAVDGLRLLARLLAAQQALDVRFAWHGGSGSRNTTGDGREGPFNLWRQPAAQRRTLRVQTTGSDMSQW